MINYKVLKYILGYMVLNKLRAHAEHELRERLFNLVALNCLPYLLCVIKVFIILFQIKFIRSSDLKPIFCFVFLIYHSFVSTKQFNFFQSKNIRVLLSSIHFCITVIFIL